MSLVIANSYIRIRERTKFVSMHLLRSHEAFSVKDFEAYCTDIIANPKNVIISLVGVPFVEVKVMDAFNLLQRRLAALKKNLYIVYAGSELKARIAPQMEKVKFFSDLQSAMQDFGKVEPSEGMHFIKCFVSSTEKTLEVQAKVKCIKEKIQISRFTGKLNGDVSGFIIVTSKTMGSYVLIISFPVITYLEIISNLLGEKIAELTDEVADGAAELLNIIFGQTKALIGSTSQITPSMPILIKGNQIKPKVSEQQDFLAEFLKTSKNVEIHFKIDSGPFFVTVAFPQTFNAADLRK